MNGPNYEGIIIQIVSDMQGVKETDLALKCMEKMSPVKFDSELFRQSLVELVSKRYLKCVEYVLPNLDYRAKSFYLPARTKISIHS